MGLSVTASAAIILTAAILGAIVLFESVENARDHLSEAQESQEEAQRSQDVARLEFVSVKDSGGGLVEVTVKNTGESQLKGSSKGRLHFEFLVNGYLVSENILNSSLTIANHKWTTIFNPGEEMNFMLEDYTPVTGDIIMIIFYEGCSAHYVYE